MGMRKWKDERGWDLNWMVVGEVGGEGGDVGGVVGRDGWEVGDGDDGGEVEGDGEDEEECVLVDTGRV